MRLPPVLTQTELPLPELQAALLDGELFRLGSGFAPIDEPDSPANRARSVLTTLPDRVIVEQHSAAWVWGAAPPPARHEVCVAIGARCRIPDPKTVLLREVIIDPAEIALVECLRVTTPLRTVIDLLRFSATFGSVEHHAVRWLQSRHDFNARDVMAALGERRNLPGIRRARDRLKALANPN